MYTLVCGCSSVYILQGGKIECGCVWRKCLICAEFVCLDQSIMVLNEADRLLEMGFKEEVSQSRLL